MKRHTHHLLTITITGKSYRMREAAGVSKPAKAPIGSAAEN